MPAPGELRLMVVETIRGHLAEVDIDPELIVDAAEFGVDLAVDSLELQTLAQELTDTYGVTLAPRDTEGLTTVGAVADHVVAAVERARTGA
jgi:acyl carrier protein